MDRYDPATVFSSIDREGRYAYGNQPSIAHWNLVRFAETLVPLLDPNEDTAIEIAKACLEDFGSEFSELWRKGMRSKLGLFESKPEDESLVEDLLNWMHQNKRDFTNTFRSLALGREVAESDLTWNAWHARLKHRRNAEGRAVEDVRALMLQSSPNIIPRNHHVEEALSAAVEKKDLSPFQKFLSALEHPFENRPEHSPYLEPSPCDDEYQTFCGT